MRNEDAGPTAFEGMGGAEGMDRLVQTFYARMDALPDARPIRAMHGPNLASTKTILKRYLGEWLGGPSLYSQDRRHPRPRMRHIRFPIGEDERDAWLLCMLGAMEETVEPPQPRAELRESLSRLADWMRNQPAAKAKASADRFARYCISRRSER